MVCIISQPTLIACIRFLRYIHVDTYDMLIYFQWYVYTTMEHCDDTAMEHCDDKIFGEL